MNDFVRDGSLASVSFLGWLLSYTYPLVFLGPLITNCTGASEDAGVISLVIYTPMLLISIPLIFAGRRWARQLRWFVVPHVVTVLLAISYLPDALAHSTVGGEHLCDIKVAPDTYGVAAPLWHRLYAPLELLVLILFASFAIWFWRVPNRGVPRYDVSRAG